MKNYLFLLLCIFILSSCGEDKAITPKPRSYPRIIFPERAYQQFDTNFCNFTFEYPKYAVIEQSKEYFGSPPPNSCWFNIVVPQFAAYIYCTYYPLGKENKFDKVVNDAFTFADQHTIKADYIDELPINKPGHVSGMIFNIEGDVASSFQFYLTDSTKNFLRGALYIKAHTNQDSLAPVINFMKTDVMQMINTFKWKK
jgi:gliding motility-associated lipoprotein GldD